jgi:hypothetical protein
MIFADTKPNQLSFPLLNEVKAVLLATVVGMSVFWAPGRIAQGHVYKDGFVERSLSITIRGEVGHGELLIGLNEKTAACVMSEARLAQTALESGRPAKDDLKLPDLSETPSGDRNLVGGANGKAAVGISEAIRSEGISKPNLLGQKNTSEPNKQSLPNQRIGEGQHLTDRETINKLSNLKARWVSDGLKLSLNGRALDLKNLTVGPAPRHPYSVLVKFSFSLDGEQESRAEAAVQVDEMDLKHAKKDLEVGEGMSRPTGQGPFDNSDGGSANEPKNSLRFRLVDELFPRQSGAVRYSLRARGSTILLRSNVAPVIVRAERFEFDKPRSMVKSDLFTIDAILAAER